MNQLTEKGMFLLFNGERHNPLSQSRNVIGFCSTCGSDLESLAYYSTDSEWLVSAQCAKGHLALIRYGRDWSWLDDLPLEFLKEEVNVADLPREKLDAIFTPAEIRDMIACQEGSPYVRQNIYRARTKYERFEKLFGIKIDI
jgi:hypothetical protein